MSLAQVYPLDDSGFTEIICPNCGHIENLSADVEGVWECEKCAEAFYMTLCVLVEQDDPELSIAALALGEPHPFVFSVGCQHKKKTRLPHGAIYCNDCGKLFASESVQNR